MQDFAPVPEDVVGARLPEPPVRLRVMEELAGDASALLEHFRDRGMTEEAAALEVQAWLGTRPEVWREMEEIHRPIAVRWWHRGWLDPATRIAPEDTLALLALGAPVVGLLGAGLTLTRASDGDLAFWSAIETASGIATVGLMVGIAGGVFWSVQKAWYGLNSSAATGGA